VDSKRKTGESPQEGLEASWQRSLDAQLTLLGLTALVLVLLLVAVGLWWRSARTQSAVSTPGTRGAPPSQPPRPLPVPVAVVTPRRVPARETISLPVNRSPGSSRPVSAPRGGIVSQRVVARGERVRRGQTVAVLAPPPRRPDTAPHRPRGSDRPASPVAPSAHPVQEAVDRLARAEQAARAAEASLAQAAASASSAAAAPEDRTAMERRVARAREELSEREARLRETEQLLQAGAASRAERREDAEARAEAARELERARAARAAGPPPPAGEGVDPNLASARARLARARSEVAAARTALRTAQQTQTVLAPSRQANRSAATQAGKQQSSPSTGTLGWRAASRRVPVHAPSPGIVTRWSVSTGTTVAPGQTLFWLSPGGSQTLRAIGPGRLSRLATGTPVRLRTSGGWTLKARIRGVEPVRGSQQVQVSVAALEPLPPSAGAGLRLELELATQGSALAVPHQAVRRREEAAEVWSVSRETVEGGGEAWVARRRPVRLGPTSSGRVTIHSGLNADHRVVVAGMERLRDGEVVAVVPWSLP
jgi:RND family efflux transporter MFP subunit